MNYLLTIESLRYTRPFACPELMILLLRPNLELLRREYAIGRGLESPIVQLMSPPVCAYPRTLDYHRVISFRQEACMDTASMVEDMQNSNRNCKTCFKELGSKL